MYLILEALMLVSLGGLIAVFQNDLLGWTALLKSITSLLFVFAFRHPAAFLAFWNWDTERDSVCQLDSLLSGAGMPVGFSE